LIKNKKIISAGTLGQLLLISRGHNLGKQNKLLKNYKALEKKFKKLTHIKAPKDYAFEIKGKRKEFLVEELPVNYEVMDIGSKTIEFYINEIKKAKAIYVKGTLGYCEDSKFCKGTFEILKAISKSKATSILGGGHLTTALEKSKISKKKFSHVSLSGGALVQYIAGEKLPGLEALRKNENKTSKKERS
ncbi:MAG: phosphoglycerate kinase, partial [Nanoarchaeota archaeon]|nr:phosphoglycerate kinase [Nanoarchaeota archaeon]